MRNVRILFVLMGAVGFIVSCNYKKQGQGENEAPLIIKTGRICGSCNEHDSLTLTASNTSYYRFDNVCFHTDKYVSTSTNLQNWKDLQQLLDWTKFTELSINSCAICYDGCDTWITIYRNGVKHGIRFDSNDSIKIAPIKQLVTKLDSTIQAFR